MFENLSRYGLGKSMYMEMLLTSLSYREFWAGTQIPRLTSKPLPQWMLLSTQGRGCLPSQAPDNQWDHVWGFRIADMSLAQLARQLP